VCIRFLGPSRVDGDRLLFAEPPADLRVVVLSVFSALGALVHFTRDDEVAVLLVLAGGMSIEVREALLSFELDAFAGRLFPFAVCRCTSSRYLRFPSTSRLRTLSGTSIPPRARNASSSLDRRIQMGVAFARASP